MCPKRTSEPSFTKQLVYPGQGEILHFPKNSKAVFHFRTYPPKEDESGLDNTHHPTNIMDDSRTMGNGPFELLIGREFKLSVWDEMVKTMRRSEVAKFTCPFIKIMEYPKVSKALREMAQSKEGKTTPHQQDHHHCSLSALQGTGHPDLDKILEDQSPLCFELELLRVENPGEYKQDHWAMSDAEKNSAIPKLKEEGNLLYKQGNLEAASLKYYEALSYLEGQVIKEKPQCEEWQSISMRKVPFLLNYSQCKMVLKEFADVVRHTTMVLEIEKDNVKALYKRGMACSASWDVDGAKGDLGRAAELQPSLKRVVEQELQDLAKRVREKDVAERKRLQGKMFY